MKTIVICSDGTSNRFGMPHDEHATNVSKLVHHLRLDDRDRQIVVYDPGVGAVQSAADPGFLATSPGFRLLTAPSRWAFHRRAGGLLFGTGLFANVRQLLAEIARLYDDGDRLLLFGFSRGAFTVRAVAAMLYRFGLPIGTPAEIDDLIRSDWTLLHSFEPDGTEQAAIDELRNRHRAAGVHFLGLWDTVKSYGGLRPVLLPHLRHNPIVDNVRHALAYHEHRAWFLETTWGRLDMDRTGDGDHEPPMSKLQGSDLERVLKQDIKEVWFGGYHSDVGTGRTALRWMLAEAAALTPSLALSERGIELLASGDHGPDIGRDSMRWWWRVSERIPRQEPLNDRKYARRQIRWRSDGVRNPDLKRRDGLIHIHETALEAVRLLQPIREWATPATPRR